jgi:hypothetical protein
MKYIMPPKQHYIFDGANFTSKTSVDKYIRETKNKYIRETNIRSCRLKRSVNTIASISMSGLKGKPV